MIRLAVHIYSLAWVPVAAWIVLGFLVLMAVSLGVALLVGRMIRRRDDQVPTSSQTDRKL